MADLIQLRRDTKENWEKYNPILTEGEVGLILNTLQSKVGDGIHHWNDLPTRGFDGNILEEFGQNSDAVVSQKFFTEIITQLKTQIENKNKEIKELSEKITNITESLKRWENKVIDLGNSNQS